MGLRRAAELRVLSGEGERALDAVAAVADLETWRDLRLSLGAVFLHPVVAMRSTSSMSSPSGLGPSSRCRPAR